MVFVTGAEGSIIGYQVGLQSLVDILILTMCRLKGSKVSGKGPAPVLTNHSLFPLPSQGEE